MNLFFNTADILAFPSLNIQIQLLHKCFSSVLSQYKLVDKSKHQRFCELFIMSLQHSHCSVLQISEDFYIKSADDYSQLL